MLIHNYGYVKFPEYMKLALEEISAANNASKVQKLLLYTAGYLAITCLFMYLSRLLIIGVSRRIEYAFRKDLFAKLLYLPIQFYKREQTGDLVSRITNDLNDVRTMLGPGIMYIPNSLSRLAFFLPVMITLSPTLMRWIAALIAIIIVLILIIMPILRPLYKKIQEVRASINNEAWQFILGHTTIKLNTIEKEKSRQFNALSFNYLKANLRLTIFEGLTWPLFFFIFSLSAVLILTIGGREVIAGMMTLEELLQFNVMLGILTFSVFSLGWVMSLLQQGISALERINQFFMEPAPDLTKTATLPASGKPLGIKVTELTLKDEYARKVITQLSLDIRPGEMIGITGKTGSGKTALLEMLMGITPPSSGSVYLGNHNIFTLKSQSLYEVITLVPQETFLFSTSIKNNIAFEEEANPHFPRVVEAAKLSDIHKDITKFPQQYEQILGERGITLSGGQKQRTAIGRALYKRASILVLDDALSSVDSETEEIIINNLRTLKNLKTIIIASHKISLLKLCDRIIFLEAGRITETGTHKQLLAQKGAYAKLTKLQQLKAAIDS